MVNTLISIGIVDVIPNITRYNLDISNQSHVTFHNIQNVFNHENRRNLIKLPKHYSCIQCTRFTNNLIGIYIHQVVLYNSSIKLLSLNLMGFTDFLFLISNAFLDLIHSKLVLKIGTILLFSEMFAFGYRSLKISSMVQNSFLGFDEFIVYR